MAQIRLTWPNEAYTARVLKFLRAAGNYQQGVRASQLEVTINRRRGREPPVPTPADFGFASLRDLLHKMKSDGTVETQDVGGQEYFVRASKATRDMWTREDAASSATRTTSSSSSSSMTRVLTGLNNMGNSCYVNAVLQVMIVTCKATSDHFLAAQCGDSSLPIGCYVIEPCSRASLRVGHNVHLHLPRNGAVTCNNLSLCLTKKLPTVQFFFQCIANCVPPANYFRGAFESDLNGASQTNGEVALEFARFLRALGSGRYTTLKPAALKKIIGSYNRIFQGGAQQDAHEFLRALISMLNDDINQGQQQALVLPQLQFDEIEEEERAEQAWTRETLANDSAVRDAFFGQRQSTLSCRSCGKESATFQSFGELILQLPEGNGSCSLKDLLSKELSPEEVDYKCARCQIMVKHSKTAKIVRLPKILIVQLGRFSYNAAGNSSKKRNIVNCDMSLNVPAAGGNKKFHLIGVTNHLGNTMASGHYIAHCYSTPLRRWIKFDDHLVSAVSPEDVKTSQGAYILFYKTSDLAQPSAMQPSSGTTSSKGTATSQPASPRPCTSAPGQTTAPRPACAMPRVAKPVRGDVEAGVAGEPRRTAKRRSAMENAHCPTPAKAFSPPPPPQSQRRASTAPVVSPVVPPPKSGSPVRGAASGARPPTISRPSPSGNSAASSPPSNGPLASAQGQAPRGTEGYADKARLPDITPAMEAEIDAALSVSSTVTLVSAFRMDITQSDLNRLTGLNWLNDEIVNFYMSMIVERSKENDRWPKVYAFSTYFYPKIMHHGHTSVARWTQNVDLFSYDLLLVPVHLGSHWCLAVVDFERSSVYYYDSMGGENLACLEALCEYLRMEHLDKKGRPYSTDGLQMVVMKEIPQQSNSSDCGIFSCQYAECIARRAKITFDQADMPYFRRRMVWEILKKNILHPTAPVVPPPKSGPPVRGAASGARPPTKSRPSPSGTSGASSPSSNGPLPSAQGQAANAERPPDTPLPNPTRWRSGMDIASGSSDDNDDDFT